jgi:hypothetical protein
MSEIIRVPNFSAINLREVTFINADAAAGTDAITVLNDSSYTGGQKILIGNLSQENTEVGTILSVASKIITLTANLSNRHIRGEIITLLFGDQIHLYRAANVDGSIPADSSFSYINVLATIQGDDASSDLVDATGSSSYWYKTTYYNTATGEETDLSQALAVRGGNYGKLVSIESVRDEAGLDDNRNIDDGKIAERRDHAEDEVLGRLAAAGYVIPLQSSNGALYVPPMVENIARILAAGYLLKQEYGAITEDAEKNGDDKIEQAYAMIKDIQEQRVTLVDTVGAAVPHTSQVSGWPDATTEFVGTDGTPEPFAMRMSKRF